MNDLTLYVLARRFYEDFVAIQEGAGWRVVDRKEHAGPGKGAESTRQLSAEELAQLEQDFKKSIKLGDMKEEIEFDLQFGDSNFTRRRSKRLVKVLGEPDIIDRLLSAKSSNQIKKICADAFNTSSKEVWGSLVEVRTPNWPISNLSLLPDSLSRHASAFMEAKRDPRFPKSDRPSSRSKQLWFLSRALAGAVYGIRTRTAINLMGSVRPDEPGVVAKISKRGRSPETKVRKHL